MTKPVFGVSDQVQHKPGCTAIKNGCMLEILDSGSRGIILSIAKTKALISWAVTVQLICAFKAAFLKTYLIRLSGIIFHNSRHQWETEYGAKKFRFLVSVR